MQGFIIFLSLVSILVAIYFLSRSRCVSTSIHMIIWQVLILMYFILYNQKMSSFFGILYLENICIFALMGELLGEKIRFRVNGDNTLSSGDLRDNFLYRILFIFIIIGIFSDVMTVISNGFSLSAFTSMSSFLQMNAKMADIRYSGAGESGGVMMSLLGLFIYAAPLLGGFIFLYSKNKSQKLTSILSIFPALLATMITNAKMGFIAATFLWIVGFVAAHICKGDVKDLFAPKRIIITLLFVVIFFLILFLSFCFRYGSFDSNTIEMVKMKMTVYGLGQIQAFSVWISDFYPHNMDVAFGKYTFIGIASKLGLVNRIQGMYELIPGVDTNVFTAYRAIVTDFGLLGGLAAMFLTGFISGTSFSTFKENGNILFLTIWCSIFYFFLYSFATSVWTYTSFVLVFTVCFIILLINKNRIKSFVLTNKIC